METPSSTRRVTRSQTKALNNSSNSSNILLSKKLHETEKVASKPRRGDKKKSQERSALLDITSDSPIVGVAKGNLQTPLSGMVKQRSSRAIKSTPGSGEALLRGQVKTLLQRVEEEAELSKMENKSMIWLHGSVGSPMGLLLAPTPANTPQLGSNLADSGLKMFTPLPVVEETMNNSQAMVSEESKEDAKESEKSVTRSLMLDFSSEKSESTLTSICSNITTSDDDDDESESKWSVQANESSTAYEEEEYEGGIEEICERIRKISVKEFKGKHTRFVYNSDDEIELVEIAKEGEKQEAGEK